MGNADVIIRTWKSYYQPPMMPTDPRNLHGNIGYRVGKKLTSDAVKLSGINCPVAGQSFRQEYRKGWTL